jgi:hypothetical protein
MRKKGDNMMLSVNDDLLDDSDEEDNEDLILVDFHDLGIEREWISICEIYSEDFLDDDLDEDEVKYVNEKISKRLSKLVLKIHICDVKRKLVILG